MIEDMEPRRGRKPAAAATRERRRQRSDLAGNMNLAVVESGLDREAYDYRWIADRGQRMHQMTARDDWNVVGQDGGELKDDATDLGSAVSIISGTKKDGSPERLYLCRKPREWAEADRAEKEERRVAVEKQVQTSVASSDPTAGDAAFTSSGQNLIRRS